ncbi:MAG TPA: heme lyase NrfEFG subunit NrfE, partial [Legionellales bacterium]|nr:heme lyase NrfEFG subunit NrfE [Legionellales bacterium]
MLAEIGLYCLILAGLFSALLGFVPMIGLMYRRVYLLDVLPFYVWGSFISVLLAYLSLTCCFLYDDFSVIYVLAHSSVSLPLLYKLCAVWGGHEGSMLLWVLVLNGWMMMVYHRRVIDEPAFMARVLLILGLLSAGLILFILATSNPFSRQFQLLNTHGQDLNPLLQDPGFLFHPPMLYMGYVGFAVPFAFALSALWLKQFKVAWVKWTRPWALAAWCCLTTGITLGSWWAYRELGWGGWWFWDPVENASFMPWLVGTALLHSLIVSEKKQQFIAWTLLLAITTFALSLVGTFLVRSGVVTSVHAFAVDPARGLYILGYLGLVIGGSLGLFALRAHTLQTQNYPAFYSREIALLLNNVVLTVMMLTVLMGTVYPILIDALGLGKISVGVPYFNSVFVPLMLPLLVVMGLGIHLRWHQDCWRRMSRMLCSMMLLSIILPTMVLGLVVNHINYYTLLGLVLATWVLMSNLWLVIKRIQQTQGLTPAFWGMILAHTGIAVTVIGVAVSSGYSLEKDVRLKPGDSVKLANYVLTFMQETALDGPN